MHSTQFLVLHTEAGASSAIRKWRLRPFSGGKVSTPTTWVLLAVASADREGLKGSGANDGREQRLQLQLGLLQLGRRVGVVHDPAAREHASPVALYARRS